MIHAYISENWNWVTTVIFIVLAFSVGLLIYGGSELVSYHQQASQVIERSGYVNTSYLDDISKGNYHGLFYITPYGPNKMKPLGHQIKYEIHGRFPVDIFHKTVQPLSFTNDYQATSQVRQNSQD